MATFKDIGKPIKDIGQPIKDIGQPIKDIGRLFTGHAEILKRFISKFELHTTDAGGALTEPRIVCVIRKSFLPLDREMTKFTQSGNAKTADSR